MDCTMGLIEEVADRAGIQLTERGSLVLVSAGDAMRLLDACESAGLRILGIEGFQVKENSLVPDMDAIADFSSTASAFSSILEARRFVNVVSSRELVLDFTVSSS